jgi:DNA-binding MarR family transcriptional regulator
MKQNEFERNIGFLVHDVARLMRKRFDERMKPLGLTRSQWWVLSCLVREDGLTQTEMVNVLDVGKVTLSGILDRLEKKDWVERRADANDRRARRVFLTSAGRDIARKMTRAGNKLTDQISSALSPTDLKRTIDSLAQLKSTLLEENKEHQTETVS